MDWGATLTTVVVEKIPPTLIISKAISCDHKASSKCNDASTKLQASYNPWLDFYSLYKVLILTSKRQKRSKDRPFSTFDSRYMWHSPLPNQSIINPRGIRFDLFHTG
ncbi:hypothetical protein KFK09_029069 [Dendrobium nobile]|uniref:Uncharacterized protein n=1 Tax=Dendrobium nobile TaxID=94219 RepID=A0A8T3A4S0_DENNO|nr:hypothetical protein KFK09_029069 [Dendrobium nobile]